MVSQVAWMLRNASLIVIEKRGNRARSIGRGPVSLDSGSGNDRRHPPKALLDSTQMTVKAMA